MTMRTSGRLVPLGVADIVAGTIMFMTALKRFTF
jgi:hypothetical protein